MNEGLLLIGIPESTFKVVRVLSNKMGCSMADVLSEGVKVLVQKNLKPEDLAEVEKV